MSVALQASTKTIDELGQAGLAELAAHLWPGDCQTCGRPLGDQPPALLVNDMIVSVSASLHHPSCQHPDWNDSGGISMSGADLLTHVTYTVMAPFPADPTSGDPAGDSVSDAGGDGVEMRPMLLVNPGLELVLLRRGPDQRWRVATVEFYARHGLRPPGADLRGLDLAHPVPGVRARLTPAGLVIEFPHATWEAPFDAAFNARVRELGGVVLAVTTMVHPSQLTTDPQRLAAAVRADQVAMGWITVEAGEAPSAERLEQLVHPAAAAAPVGLDGLPDIAPYPGPTYDPTTGRFKIGVGAGDTAVYYALHTPGRGMEHGLIAGPPGSGRTNNLRLVLLEAIQVEHFDVMVADPLDRNGLCDLFAEIALGTARNFGVTVDLLERGVRAVEDRLAAGGYTDPDPAHRGLLIAIDDAEAVLRNKRAAALAAQIVARGAPAGVGLVVATSSIDPADFAGNTGLMLGLAATNALMMNPEYFTFLQALRANAASGADPDF